MATTLILNIPLACYGISAAFILFRILHGLIRECLPVPKSLDVEGRSQRHKRWLYRNITISLFHSTITAVLSVFCFFDEPNMLSDMINTKTTVSCVLVTFSMGYFIHDFLDVAVNDFYKQMGLILHHAVVCVAFGLALFGEVYFGFAVCSLLMEINSIFLHLRRLLLFNGFSKRSVPFQVNGLFLLITFIFFRFLTSAWMTNFVIRNREILSVSHFILGAFNMSVVTVINLVLLLTICNSDFRKEKQIKHE